MIRVRPLLGLSGSLLVHSVAVLAAVALLSRDSPPAVLIVELGEEIRVSEPASPPRPVRAGSTKAGGAGPERLATSPAGAVSSLGPPPAPPSPFPPELLTPAEIPGLPEPGLVPPAATPERAAGPGREPDRIEGAGGGFVREVVGGGIPGGGPVGMVAPSGRGEGEGAGILAAAPSRGGEAGIPAEFGPYLARFRQRIQESLAYPLAARRRGLAGTVRLEVELLPSGQVGSVVVRSSSFHAILDEAAVDAVRGLSPIPFPPGVPPRPLRVRLPIVFELQ